MKITFMEEIEVKRALFDTRFGCSHCGEMKYNIHHQLSPATTNCWWVQCPNCEHESPHAVDRANALMRWKEEC